MTAFLNSKLFRFAFREYFPELLGNTRELSKIYFENVRVIPINDLQNNLFTNLVDKIVNLKIKGENSMPLQEEIENHLAIIYTLSNDEINLINSRS